MRILQVLPSYLPAERYGGPVFAVHGLSRTLVERGHEVHVFTTNIDGSGTLTLDTNATHWLDGVRVRYFPIGALRRLHRAPAMREALRRETAAFSVVHLHSLFLWPTLVAAREAQRAGVPYLVSPRGMLVKDLLRRRGRIRKLMWLSLFERRTLERARGLVVTTDLEAREAQEFGLRLPPIHVIPNGVDVGSYSSVPASPASPRPPYLLFLGRISWKKGIDRLIEAMPRVPEHTLVIAGPDDEGLRPALVATAERARVAARVLFAGAVDAESKVGLLANASLLVLPSLSENFGNVVLEALAAGCPVAITPGVGLAEAVRAAGAGRVIPTEPRAMGDALSELLSDHESLAAMRRAGPELARTQFAWPAIAARMEAIYAEQQARP